LHRGAGVARGGIDLPFWCNGVSQALSLVCGDGCPTFQHLALLSYELMVVLEATLRRVHLAWLINGLFGYAP
jgi:hypothetical protein